MSEQIDVESALEDAIFDLSALEDVYDLALMRSRVAMVIEECLRPALAAVKANEKRIQKARELLGTVLAIDEVVTDDAKRDPGVLPVLRKLDCKVAQLTAPELLASPDLYNALQKSVEALRCTIVDCELLGKTMRSETKRLCDLAYANGDAVLAAARGEEVKL